VIFDAIEKATGVSMHRIAAIILWLIDAGLNV
jgi:hypothetical protein